MIQVVSKRANHCEDEGKVNGMELAEAFMEEYLTAKQVWELERNAIIKNTQMKNEDMEDITCKLAHITLIQGHSLFPKTLMLSFTVTHIPSTSILVIRTSSS